MTTSLLYFYGLFLIVCGIVSVLLIGGKAKTALFSGGTSGLITILVAYALSIGKAEFRWAGMIIAFGLFIIFSWRAAKLYLRFLNSFLHLIPNYVERESPF